MNKTLIVCEKPYFRRAIERYCSRTLSKDTILHFDTIAFVTALDNTHISPIRTIDGEYRVGTINGGVPFFNFELSNLDLDTSNYIIDQTNRIKRTLNIDYNAVVFACDPDVESVLSAYEYCDRHNISLDKAYFIGIPCVLETYVKNIIDKSTWFSLANPSVLFTSISQ